MTKLEKIILSLSTLGFIDSLYLTYEHYQSDLAVCSTGIFSSCNDVLTSSYAELYGIPLALFGVFHYGVFTLTNIYFFRTKNKYSGAIVVLLSYLGLAVSAYLVYLQAFVLNAYCIYCMISALTSLFLFVLVWKNYKRYRKFLNIFTTRVLYRSLLKRILFKINPEIVHEQFVNFGSSLGKTSLTRFLLSSFYRQDEDLLKQELVGIDFQNPIGLAAGFDYDAKLTQVLHTLDFGFHTVGTVTNMPYEGNPKPRLGRLPKSKSLMVNKGFKSEGADAVIDRLFGNFFEIPIGVSIGRTNSNKLKTQKQSVEDIISAFKKFENLSLNHDYYELNISCPNLFGDITFYPSKNLEQLLKEVDKLKLSRPVFIKMPIEKSDKDVLRMLKIIDKYRVQGVIFGNLQKDRNNEVLIKEEVEKFDTGNFSGRPTYERSNHLISLAYKHYKDRFIIIGCGGVFNAEDAYEKIKRGASLVQMITGMIFQGPQTISEINFNLMELLEKDGYTSINEAIGKKHAKR